MDKIDGTLSAAMTAKPNDHWDVLITCTDDTATVFSALDKMGVSAGRDLVTLGILTARLSNSQINELAALPQVETIALDENAQTQ